MQKTCRKTCLISAVLPVLLLISSAAAQQFVDSGQSFPGLYAGSAHWGFYDSGGSQDLVLTGLNSSGYPVTLVYENTGGALSEISHTITGVYFGSAVWGDYDNDGDADIFVIGLDSLGNSIAELWQNNDGTFEPDDNQSLTGLRYSSAAWGDYNNDGLLDLITTGMDWLGAPRTILYKNTRGEGVNKYILVEETLQSFLDIAKGGAVFGDYDDDGDLDIVISGIDANGFPNAVMYKNDPVGFFVNDNENSDRLEKLSSGTLSWSDADGDGDLDLLQTGLNSRWEPVIVLYENEPTGRLRGNLLKAAQDIAGPAAWGDFDNDGDYDIAAAGKNQFSNLYGNVLEQSSSGTFTENSGAFTGLREGALAIADFDADGVLDMVASGVDGSGQFQTVLYRNGAVVPTSKPQPPSALNQAIVTNDMVILTWDKGSDYYTPDNLLSYNVRIGVLDNKDKIMSSVVPVGPGNTGVKLNLNLYTQLSEGTYYWSVQTVNAQYRKSDWSSEEIFRVEQFVSSLQNIKGFEEAATAWGDYDNDGDLDLVVAGMDANKENRALLYINDDGTLVEDYQVNNALIKFNYGDFAWGDVDNDGDLDLAYTGFFIRESGTSGLYTNDNGTLTEHEGVFAEVGFASLEWGDYDNDGDLDLAVMGKTDAGPYITKVYRNTGGTLAEDTDQTLMGYANGALKWADYDSDGDLDLTVTGQSANGDNKIRLYKNDPPGTLTEDAGNSALPSFQSSDIAWADLDDDGDLDMVVAGYNDQSATVKTLIFKNDPAGTLTEDAALSANLQGVYGCSITLGDYDNDGDPDLVVSGHDLSAPVLKVYKNNTTSFDEEVITIFNNRGLYFSSVSLVDIDNDGDLDLTTVGLTTTDGINFSASAVVFDNVNSRSNPNTAPLQPDGLTSHVTGGASFLSWQPAVDLPIGDPQRDSLTYQIRVGKKSGGSEIVSGIHPPEIGRFGSLTHRTLTGLQSGVYYWGVRAVDNGFAASDWSVEQDFQIDVDPPTVGADSVTVTPDSASAGVVTIVINVTENFQMDNLALPVVKVKLADERELPVTMLSFSGNVWVGELAILEEYPSGTVALGASGFTDAVGNVMVPDDTVRLFYLDTQRPPTVSADQVTVTPEFSGVGAVTVIMGVTENFDLDYSAYPAVTAHLSDESTAPVTLSSYADKTWIGKLNILESHPNGTVTIGVSGITDAAGNVMTPLDSVKAFVIDTERPLVESVTPAVPEEGILAGVKTSVLISATFNEPVDSASVGSDALKLLQGTQEVVPTNSVQLSSDFLSIFALYSHLRSNTQYRAVVASKITDRAGNRMGSDYSWEFKTALIVSALTGGDVYNADSSVVLYFSPTALSLDAEIPIEEAAPAILPVLSGVTYANVAYHIGPTDDLLLDKPVKLVIHYTDADIAGLNENKLAMYRQHGDDQSQWDKIGGTVETAAKSVTASVTALGTFALFEDLTTGGTESITDISFTPRIFAPNGTGVLPRETLINFVLGTDMNVTLLIFNTSGRPVRRLLENRLLNAGRQSITWDGKDGDGRILPSGLYSVVIQAGGRTEIKLVGISNK